MSLIINMFNYKKWADERALSAARSINGAQFLEQINFIRQQLNHLVLVEENFKARLLGAAEPHSVNNTEIVPALDSLITQVTDLNRWYQGYISNLSEDDLNEQINFKFVDGKKGSMSKLEILFHIVNHSTYHRGAIGKALDMSGGLRPADTYTVFIHQAEPQRRKI